MAVIAPRSRILSLASAFPEEVLSNEALAQQVDTSDAWIRERTGIEERRRLAPGQNNSDIAAQAARSALARAGLTVADVDLILACTNTPDRWLPSLGATIQAKLACPRPVPAYDIVTACAGWLAGLQAADAFIRVGHYRHVLVIGSEALTRFVDWSDRNTCVLFGDGAGAAVLGPAHAGDAGEVLDVILHSDGRHGDIMDLPAGGTRQPSTVATAAERAHCIHMDGAEVFNHAVRDMVAVSQELLQRHGLSVDDIDWFVPHQANLRIIQSVARRLRVPEHKVATNIAKYGNTSTATIPTCLDEYAQAGKIRRGDLILMCVFGGGLTWAAALLRW
jgi:3-oxoacyl-[acyl-carrier-protein] synthase III